MVGRQVAIIVGIATLLPSLIFYGVCIFSSPPKWGDYNKVVLHGPNVTAEERAASVEKQKAE